VRLREGLPLGGHDSCSALLHLDSGRRNTWCFTAASQTAYPTHREGGAAGGPRDSRGSVVRRSSDSTRKGTSSDTHIRRLRISVFDCCARKDHLGRRINSALLSRRVEKKRNTEREVPPRYLALGLIVVSIILLGDLVIVRDQKSASMTALAVLVPTLLALVVALVTWRMFLANRSESHKRAEIDQHG
jgi:hypothetical protein